MNTPYTFEQAVHAIGVNTHNPDRPFPRSFRDNHPVSQLLCIDWRTAAGRDAWLDYFGAKANGSVAWSSDWHGWRVLMTAHFGDVEDSGPVGIEQRHGSPPADPGTTRIHGRHRAEDLDRAPTVVAALTPDAPVPLPPGVKGYAVAPDVHTGQPEPERDGWDDHTAPTYQGVTP